MRHLKKYIWIAAICLSLMIAGGIALADTWDDAYQAFLEETRKDSVEDEECYLVQTGNIFGLKPRDARSVNMRAWAVCDKVPFIVGQTSTITVTATGGYPDYTMTYTPYRKMMSDSQPDYTTYGDWDIPFSNSFSITPDDEYRYLIDVKVVDTLGNYIIFSTGVYETVTENSLSDPSTLGGKIKAIVSEVIRDEMTDYEKALALHDWLIRNADYDYNYVYYSPEGVLLYGTGVCDSYARAYQMLLSEVNIKSIYISSDPMEHAWNMIYVNGGWYHVDVTWDDPGSEDDPLHDYFCLTDEQMAEDHEWPGYNDYDQVPPPSGDDTLQPTIQKLSEGQTQIFVGTGGNVEIKFTACVSGTYVFYTTGSTDTYGYLRDLSGSKLVESSEGGEGDNFRIEYQLTPSQTVYLGITLFNGSDNGMVDLIIKKKSEVITEGLTEVTIDEDEVVWHEFTANIQGTYTFYTTGTSDTYGFLCDSSGNILDRNDDGGEGYNFRIEYPLKINQTVYLGVTFFGDPDSETVELTIKKKAEVITEGQTQMTIDAGEIVWYEFTAPRRGIYSFYTNGSSDTVGYLSSLSGDLLDCNDDSGDGYNFKLEYPLLEDDSVMVGIVDYNGSANGETKLNIRQKNADITEGQTQLLMRAGDIVWYEFTASVKGTYVFSTAGSSDTKGCLYDWSPNLLEINDNDGDDNNFRIEYPMTNGQTVIVCVYLCAGSSGEDLILTVEKKAEVITEDLTQVSVDENEIKWLKFTADSDGIYSFYTAGVFDNIDTIGYLCSDTGICMCIDDDSGEEGNFLINYGLCAGQTVFVGVQLNNDDDSGTVMLNIRKLLHTLKLPASLTVIGPESFVNIAAEIVILPENCSRIETGAFKNCSCLKAIQITGDSVYLEEEVFDGCGRIIVYDGYWQIVTTIVP